MTNEQEQAGRVYAPALMRMVELLGSTPKVLTFGAAFEQALCELELPKPDLATETAMLSLAWKIIDSGRVPGCPDA